MDLRISLDRRKIIMKRALISVLMALVLVIAPAIGANAASTATVTVTAVPSFLDISVAPTTWTINGIDGNGTIATNTVYYANPAGSSGDVTAPNATIVDGDCQFTATNSSTVPVNIAINMSDFSGGNAMTNNGTGYSTNGATTYGASVYVSGLAWPGGAVTAAASSSSNSITSLAASGTKKFGVAIKTRTDAWTAGTSLTSTITLTATSAS